MMARKQEEAVGRVEDQAKAKYLLKGSGGSGSAGHEYPERPSCGDICACEVGVRRIAVCVEGDAVCANASETACLFHHWCGDLGW
jgi:hypothetical protein